MVCKAISLMYALPQLPFLNDDKTDRFFKKLAYPQEDPQWHARRMAGFGGSELVSCYVNVMGRLQTPHEPPLKPQIKWSRKTLTPITHTTMQARHLNRGPYLCSLY